MNPLSGEDELAAARRAQEVAEHRLADARSDARTLAAQNEALNAALREARDQLLAARDSLGGAQEPLSAGIVVGRPAPDRLDVSVGGRLVRLAVSTELEAEVGMQAWVDESQSVVTVEPMPLSGEVAIVSEPLADGKAVVTGGGEASEVVTLGPGITGEVRPGDALLVDHRAHLAYGRVERPPSDVLALEETPNVTYADIGGLDAEIALVRDAVELPFLERERFQRYKLRAPKGVLLYGPPGCGKTMLAKAVANSLGAHAGGQAHFLSVRGPELLSKYVGETERLIRDVFGRARERASDGLPVVIFFDEMDALFRTRGSGVSSDVEHTIVPALLTELDGAEALRNVLVIGASNREDLIDPAVLRPGRLDVLIRLDRPGPDAAREIFARHLTPDVPIDPTLLSECGDPVVAARALSELAITEIYSGDPAKRVPVSGALIAAVVDRAKQAAVKRAIAHGIEGIAPVDVLNAVRAEFAQQVQVTARSSLVQAQA